MISNRSLVSLAEKLIALVIVVMPFHAFLTLWLSSAVGHFTLIRLWKEGIVIILAIIIAILVWREPKLRNSIIHSKLFIIALAYNLFCVTIGLFAYIAGKVTLYAFLYGLLLDTRYIVWFGIVYVAARCSGWLGRNWKKLIFIPLALVTLFALLQFFILPRNFLEHFGYNSGHTSFVAVVPLNQDSPTIRVTAFSRGANPLGAYLATFLTLLVVVIYSKKRAIMLWALAATTFIALFLTFSRSAWLGFIVALTAFIWVTFRNVRKIYTFGLLALVGVLVLGAVVVKSGSVQNAIFHVNDDTTATVTSNDGHAGALEESVRAFVMWPLGYGPGTAGQASWYNTGHRTINTESYLLQLLLEIGLLGCTFLVYFMWIILRRLQAMVEGGGLPVGVFATLIGFVPINLVSYGWTDDTLVYLWWGLAAIALASPIVKPQKQHG